MIELNNVWKSYGANAVLKSVNLVAKPGEFIAIRGKSGTGKTTLLKIIGLLEAVDKGEVRLFDKTVNKLNDNEKSAFRLHSIGFVFQLFNLIPSLTVLENIELPMALAATDKRERIRRVRELLEYFSLTDIAQRFPENLSGGERQRIAIIRALANNPQIILADEPTSSIDDENSELVIKLLSKINHEKKVTILLTTTDLYEKLPATKDYILKEGRLYEGPQTDLTGS